MADEVKTFPPPPEEPVRIFCPQQFAYLHEAWKKISFMRNVEWSADWSKCKIMIFHAGSCGMVAPPLAEHMKKFFSRDGRESLVYAYDHRYPHFVEWPHDVFDRCPWKVLDAS